MGNLTSMPQRAKLFRKSKAKKAAAISEDTEIAEQPICASFVTEDPAFTFPCTDEPVSELDAIKTCSLSGLPYNPKKYGPPKPACNDMRARTVQALNSMDAPPDGELDNILKLVQNIFKCPAALVALFDDSRIFVRNGRGFAEGDFPWRWSFCAWTLAPCHHQTMVIEDVTKDLRFSDNAVAKEFGIKFYCGAPLVASNGHRLGTICFIDTKPRKMDPFSCQILNNFAELVVRELEKDIALLLKDQESKALQAVYSKMIRKIDCFESPVLFTDTSEPNWQLLYANQAWENTTGVARAEVLSAPLDQLFEKDDGTPIQCNELRALCSDMAVFEISGLRCTKVPNKLFTLIFRPAGQELLDDDAPIAAGMPSFVDLDFTKNRQYYFMNVKEDPANSASRTKRISSHLFPEMPCQKLAGLELGALLGSGAQGRVYYGTWFGTNVAVKVIEADGHFSSEGCKEAWLTAELAHPNIVRLLKAVEVQPAGCEVGMRPAACEDSQSMDSAAMLPEMNDNSSSKGSVLSYGDHDSWNSSSCLQSETWMIMEFCDRGSLQDAIDRGWLRSDPTDSCAPPNEKAVLTTAMEIAFALQYLHSKDIIHGDLSPYNVLLSSTGPNTSVANRGFIAKVADFGLSRALDIKSRINTKTYGTITIMPPELIAEGTLSKATDVYAFGVLLWQMSTSSRPWSNLSHAQIIQAVLNQKRQLVFPEGLPQSIAQIGELCMSFKRADRPTMDWVVTKLLELQGDDAAPVEPAPYALEANSYLQSL